MITAEQINAAYDRVNRAIYNLADATALEAHQRGVLEGEKADLLARGLIDGKNAETREGQLRERLASEYKVLAEVQAQVALARTNLTACQSEIDRCKTLLKLLEVTVPEVGISDEPPFMYGAKP
ncbi:hypothetical protein [Deinococcus radiotolerans]|uniref:YlbF family regulator n=1 Tax=Deinococcus radiotolerans TaxID=1309407 RepID=A0ABQ2FFT1_9DEIO|nr:hypothetical protein [Deinococcus radiotolerans]GGK91570.1 hypothetical protein GCM10010844_07590 [Deinococcus radiotolerans]